MPVTLRSMSFTAASSSGWRRPVMRIYAPSDTNCLAVSRRYHCCRGWPGRFFLTVCWCSWFPVIDSSCFLVKGKLLVCGSTNACHIYSSVVLSWLSSAFNNGAWQACHDRFPTHFVTCKAPVVPKSKSVRFVSRARIRFHELFDVAGTTLVEHWVILVTRARTSTLFPLPRNGLNSGGLPEPCRTPPFGSTHAYVPNKEQICDHQSVTSNLTPIVSRGGRCHGRSSLPWAEGAIRPGTGHLVGDALKESATAKVTGSNASPRYQRSFGPRGGKLTWFCSWTCSLKSGTKSRVSKSRGSLWRNRRFSKPAASYDAE